MNKSYKSIWNESLGAWVAISELTRSRSKRSRAGRAADVLRSAVVSVGALALGVGVAWGQATASSVALTGAADTSSAPVNGSLVYNTATANTGGDAVSPGLYVWSAGKWIRADTQFAQVNPNSAGVAGAAAQATGDQSIAVGTGAFAQGQQSVAIGDAAKATNQAGMAIGNLANSSGQAAMAIGLESKAASENSLAIGSQATAIGNADISVGANAGLGGLLTNNDNTSIGQSSGQFVSGRVNTAIGIDSGKNVTGDYNIALGSAAGSGIAASRTVSIGTDATASKNYAIALGSGAQSSGVSATAVGTNSRAQGQQSIAVGEAAQATALGSIAIGASALANNANDVALGANSMTAAAVGTSNATVGTTTYGDFAGTAPLSTVSIGAVGAERTLTNVAAGRITAASTDAINGSQLFSVANTLSTSITNVAASGVQYGKNPDGSINYSSVPLGAPGSIASTDGGLTGGTTISNVAQGAVNALSTDAINGAQLFQIAGDTSKTYNTLNGGGIRYTRTNDTGLAQSDAFAQGKGSTAVGYNASTDLAATDALALGNGSTANGVASTAVGTNSLAQGQQSIAVGEAAQATALGSIAIGASALANNANDVALGANSMTAAAVGTSNATVGTTTYGDFAGTAPLSTVSIGAVGAERTLTNVAAGRITAASTDAINGSQLFSVANTLSTSITNVAASGVQYGKNPDGSINYSSVPLGGPVSKDGGLTGGTTISNVAQGAVNALSTDAVNGAQLNTTNTNLTALANNPLTFTGNSGTVQRKLGEELRITGTGTTPGAYSGANLKTEVVGNEVRIKMADAPTFTSVNTANLTVTNTANLNTLNVTGPATLSGGTTISNMLAVAPATVVNMGGNVITNVAAGTNQTDAVNVQQLQKMQGGGVQYAKNLDGSINQGSVVLGSGQAGGTMVSNVAPGVAGTDAVNVNQMNTGLSSVGKVINDLAQRIDGNEKNADAGTAGAMAMASMPQAFIPGKSMLGAGAATYQGQTAIAIGVSKLSENGKWVLKLNGAANSRGKVGVSVGAGFHW